ncbi:MAG: DUF4349 domain-containing protein [Frankia sp.]|nr:DUF4349 domain-containing protein [Frankia sp.]
MTRRGVAAGAGLLVVLLVAIALVTGGSGGGDDESAGGAALPAPVEDLGGSAAREAVAPDAGLTSEGAAAAAAAPVAPGAEVSRQPASSVPAPPPGTDDGAARPAGVEPRIVRTGTMTLEVEAGGVPEAMRTISTAAEGLGGYVSASETSGTAATDDSERQSGSMTLRVPSASFSRLQDAVTDAGTVRSSTMTSQDVTAQYVDLEARKTALESSRATYLGMLAEAKSVAEILSVQQQIDLVQMQIEQIEGQRRVLGDASDLATLTVEIFEPGTRYEPPSERNWFIRAVDGAWDDFVDGIEDVIRALGTLGVIVVVVLLLYLAYRLARALFRRAGGRSPGTGDDTAGTGDDTAGTGGGSGGGGDSDNDGPGAPEPPADGGADAEPAAAGPSAKPAGGAAS